MRVLLQRVRNAKVTIDGGVYSEIKNGLLIFLGVEDDDYQEDIDWLVRKIIAMRIFQDDQDKMNLSLEEINGQVMIISQFTLHASTKKGNRPSFIKAAKPIKAIPLYNSFVNIFSSNYSGIVKEGVFGAYMQVELVNDGPVTIWIDSKNKE